MASRRQKTEGRRQKSEGRRQAVKPKIKEFRLGELKPAKYNPRIISDLSAVVPEGRRLDEVMQNIN